MAFDAFLKIATIPGESTDDKHKDWIEILSFSHSLSQPSSSTGASAGGARTSGRVEMQDFSVVKTLDKASPKLALACCKGEHIKDVTLELCRAGGDKQKYMVYKLTDAVVANVRNGGSAKGGDQLPTEEVSFHFAKIEWTFTVIDSTGKAKGNVPAYWDLQKNAGG